MITTPTKDTDRIQDIPDLHKKKFTAAYEGNSRAKAVKAKCLDCSLFQREEIKNCTVFGCPLWRYRPYV